MTEDGSEMASTKVISIYKNSNKTRVFIKRKLSLSKIFEEESENPVEVERDEQKQLESICEEGRHNIVFDEGEMSEKTKLTYRTYYLKEDDAKNGLEDNLMTKAVEEDNCGSKVIIQCLPDNINTSSVTYG